MNSSTNTPITKKITLARFACLCFCYVACIEDITRWREDMNFIFEWWFSEDFRPLSEDFRRFFKIVPKARRTFPNIFRKFPRIPEDVRRLPRTFEGDPKMFRWYTDEFKYNLRDKRDITEIIDIFTCEDIISSHVRISYRFYRFVTTRYTTDFYIIN